MSIKISNLTIKVNKKSLNLSLEEAKELFESLNTFFGPKVNYNYSWPYSTGITLATNGVNSSNVTYTAGTGVTSHAGENSLINGTSIINENLLDKYNG